MAGRGRPASLNTIVKRLRDAGIYVSQLPNGEINGFGAYLTGDTKQAEARARQLADTLRRQSASSSSPNVRISKATGQAVRSYTPRSESAIKRHIQAEEKRLTKSYKNPVTETQTRYIKTVSKTGNIYYKKVETLDVEMEREFRKVQRDYNKKARAYENLVTEYNEIAKKEHRTKEDTKRLYEIDEQIAATPNLKGRMRIQNIRDRQKLEGQPWTRERWNQYFESMKLHSQGYVPRREAVDLDLTFDTLRQLTDEAIQHGDVSPEYATKIREAIAEFYVRNGNKIKYSQKSEIQEALYSVDKEDSEVVLDDDWMDYMIGLMKGEDA